jgi:antitoxin (DNA-binding transcriptional repressor) of toxin-antitoxin stability system
VATATIRDLRTRFPHLKAIIARDGELIVTDRGRPAYVLRGYIAPPAEPRKKISYFERLARRQPRPLSAASASALDEADRGER